MTHNQLNTKTYLALPRLIKHDGRYLVRVHHTHPFEFDKTTGIVVEMPQVDEYLVDVTAAVERGESEEDVVSWAVEYVEKNV